MSDASRPSASVPVLDRVQLAARLASAAPPKLVMAASEFGFRAKHIPGSIHFDPHRPTFASLDLDDEVVVYCSNLDCIASRALIKRLLEAGYRNVSHYPGGLIDWETAGLPIEGDWAGGPSPAAS